MKNNLYNQQKNLAKELSRKLRKESTKAEKIFSPLEKLEKGVFDSPSRFDLHFEAVRLSLAYTYDHLLSLSFIIV